jgi:hypothetical protein
MSRFWKWMVILAFIVTLQDGRNLQLNYAVGFVLSTYEGIAYHVFFDKDCDLVAAIKTSEIKGVRWVDRRLI